MVHAFLSTAAFDFIKGTTDKHSHSVICVSGRASETGSRDPGSRIEDRLASLEADLAHSTASTDAMSSIIDQVILFLWHGHFDTLFHTILTFYHGSRVQQ